MSDDTKSLLAELEQHGVKLVLPSARHLSLAGAAAKLDVSVDWVRGHVQEFTGAWRLPGGGRNGGEWRIPERAIDAWIADRRLPA